MESYSVSISNGRRNHWVWDICDIGIISSRWYQTWRMLIYGLPMLRNEWIRVSTRNKYLAHRKWKGSNKLPLSSEWNSEASETSIGQPTLFRLFFFCLHEFCSLWSAEVRDCFWELCSHTTLCARSSKHLLTKTRTGQIFLIKAWIFQASFQDELSTTC